MSTSIENVESGAFVTVAKPGSSMTPYSSVLNSAWTGVLNRFHAEAGDKMQESRSGNHLVAVALVVALAVVVAVAATHNPLLPAEQRQ